MEGKKKLLNVNNGLCSNAAEKMYKERLKVTFTTKTKLH